MANGSVFNLGQSLLAGQRFQAGQLALQEQQNVIANRRKANEIRQQYAAMPEQIQELETQGLFDEAAQLRNQYIQTQKSSIEAMETVGRMVQPEDYQQFRSDMIQAGAIDPSLMPVKYKKNWWKPETARQKGRLSKLTRQWGAQGAIMSQDLVTQDGQILWKGAPYQRQQPGTGKGPTADKKPFKIVASDSNSLRAAAADLYGVWDPVTQKVTATSKTVRQDIASITEEAARIYRTNEGRLTHAEAVARAARKMNIQIPDLERDPRNRDPLGLRGP